MTLFGDSAGLRLGLVPPREAPTAPDGFEQLVSLLATAVPAPQAPMSGANISWLEECSWRTEADAMLALDRMCADLGVESAHMAVFAPRDPQCAEGTGDIRLWMERWAEEREALWIDAGKTPSSTTLSSPSALASLKRAALPKNIDLTDSCDSETMEGFEMGDPWSSLVSSCLDSVATEGTPPAEWVSLPPERRFRSYSAGSSRDGAADHDGFVPLGFGNHTVLAEQIFYQTPLSFAFVNIKPVVRGHVLVSSRRSVPRFALLRPDEVADLWTTVQKIGEVVRKENGAQALTMAIQDGKEAGQTVPHVHVHVLPRRPNDFKQNDDVYARIDESERGQMRPPSDVCSPKSPFRSSRLLQRPLGDHSPDAPIEETGIPLTSSTNVGVSPRPTAPAAPAVAMPSGGSNGETGEEVSVFRASGTGAASGTNTNTNTNSSSKSMAATEATDPLDIQAQFARARRTAGRATQMVVASRESGDSAAAGNSSPMRTGGFAHKVLGDVEASKWRPARLAAQMTDRSQPFGSVRGSPLTPQGELRTASPAWKSPGNRKTSPGRGMDAADSNSPRTPTDMAREASIYRALLLSRE